MRHNDKIHWLDHCAIEAMIALVGLHTSMSYEELAAHSYAMAEAMFAEREKDEHNPTPNI